MSTTLNSFSTDPAVETTAMAGQIAHVDHFAHNERLREELITLAPGVWTLVGNGLSNQSFIEGPDGLIVVDTGECVEEMGEALRQVRTVTDTPVVAVIYTHFHYVAGTSAILAEDPDRELVIWDTPGSKTTVLVPPPRSARRTHAVSCTSSASCCLPTAPMRS